jgi:hypothetical protein
MAEVTELWGRLDTDTDRSYQAFAEYRDLGPKRSLRTAAERLLGLYVGESPAEYRRVGEGAFRPLTPEEETNIASKKRQLERWSTENRWRQRVAAYDAEQYRIAQERRLEKAEEARERALSGAHLAQSIGLKAMHVQNSRPDGQVDTNPSLNPLRVWKEGVEMEFIALGLPISVVKQHVEGPSPEQIDHQQKVDTLRRAGRAFYKQGE